MPPFFNRPGPRSAGSLPLDLISGRVPPIPPIAPSAALPPAPYLGPTTNVGPVLINGRMVNMLRRAFIAINTAPLSVLVAQSRSYLFIQNQSGVAQLVFAFGVAPGAAGVIPVDGEILGPGLGAHEYDQIIPQDELFVLGAAASVPGVVFYALDNA